MKTGTTKTTSI